MTVPRPGRVGRLAVALAIACVTLLPGAADASELGGDVGGDLGGDGDPITPGQSIQGATPVDSGVFSAEVPDQGTDQYFAVERQWAESRIWYGVSADIAGNEPSLFVDALADGETTSRCTDGEVLLGEDGGSPLVSVLRTTDVSERCRIADSIVLKVSRTGPFPDAATYQLVVWEEPRPANEDALPPGSTSVTFAPPPDAGTAEPRPVEVGRTWADAPVLEDGTWTTTLTSGETNLVRVPLTFGQHAQVVVSTGAQSLDGFSDLGGSWLSPLGGDLGARPEVAGGAPLDLVAMDGSGSPGVFATRIVAWNDQQGGDADAPAATAGDYYLMLEPVVDEHPETFEVELAVTVVTDYEGSAPEYDDEPPVFPAVSGESSQTGPEADDGDPAAAADRAGGTVPTASLVLFASSAVLVAAGAVLLRKGRTPRSPLSRSGAERTP